MKKFWVYIVAFEAGVRTLFNGIVVARSQGEAMTKASVSHLIFSVAVLTKNG